MSSRRERIREIWRPLYDLGIIGAEQINAEYMAHVVSVAVTETEQLIDEYANNEELEEE